jgi:exopolysaccharide biosynthesis polyprenyl glycosylphosphotransferase
MTDQVATADGRQGLLVPDQQRLTPRRSGDGALFALADAVSVAFTILLVRTDIVFMAVAFGVSLLIGWRHADHVQPRLSIAPGLEAVRAARFASPAVFLAGITTALGDDKPAWLAFGLTLVALTATARIMVALLLMTTRRRRLLLRQTVVACGSDLDVAERVTSMIQAHPECGLEVVAHVGSCLHADVPVVDPRTVLDLAAGDVCIVVATHDPIDPQLAKLVEEAPGVETFLTLPPLAATIASPWRSDHIWAQPVGWVPARSKRVLTIMAKRAFDLVGSLTMLLLLAPVFVAIAVAVRASSPGPIVFRQRRLGWQGGRFELLKFRTMYVHPDSDLLWSPAGDDRVTPIGRLLRRTGLDELPQLVNVLRGDMSLIGPRPERPHFAHSFAEQVPSYWRRHRLPGGLTGLAQVEDLRGDTSIADRTRFDNRYIDNWSLGGDVVILARTVRTMFRRGSH